MERPFRAAWALALVSAAWACPTAGWSQEVGVTGGGDVTTARADPATERALRRFNDDRFALFVHWGLYSQAGGVLHGTRYYGQSEWLMHNAKASTSDYLGLAKTFNPTGFDARQWIATAKAAGIRYIVITAKHHDGFAMFGSKASPHNIVDDTPYAQDPLKALAEAAHAQGVGLGFYYSQFQDWTDPNGGGNDWERDPKRIDFDLYFRTKVIPQVTELLTKYGPVREIWFDTPSTMPAKYSFQLAALVKKLQPDCLLNSRIGNGLGDYTSPSDSEILPQSLARTSWEAVFPFNHSWGYSAIDNDYKSTSQLIHMLATSAARGGNLMINMGPDGLGRFPPEATQRLRGVGDWLKANGASIYGTRRSPLRQMPWGVATTRPGTLYLHIFNAPSNGRLRVPGLDTRVTGVRLLVDGSRLDWVKADGGLTVNLPSRLPDNRDTVVAVSVKDDLADDSRGPLVLSPDYGRQVLDSADARGNGTTLQAIKTELFVDDDRKFYAWAGLDGPSKSIAWRIQVEEPGDYHLDFQYAADPAQDGREGIVEVGGQTLHFRVNGGQAVERRKPAELLYQPVGLLHFDKAGVYEISVKPASVAPGDLFALRAAYLTPAN